MSLIELRPYQKTAIDSIRECIASGMKRIMLYLPTGAGKSVVSTGIIQSALSKRKRVAFIVNRIQLIEQMSKMLYYYNISHGIIQGDNTVREYENVLVCSIQTIAKRGLPNVDLIIIDEAHAVSGSKDYIGIMETFKDIPIIAQSATPFSKGLGKQNNNLGGPLFEKLIIAATISDLIKEKYLVDCDIFGPNESDEPDMAGIKQIKNKFGEIDWSDMDVGRAVDKPKLVGNVVKHWLQLAKDTKTVVFASNIAHSKNIVERFISFGVKAAHIDCYHDSEERRAILKKFSSGEIKVISNASLLAEGFDAPDACTLILARPTKSMIRFVQMAGRVLRPFPGKEKALILDHSGTVKRLGFPTDDLPLELDDGTPKKSSMNNKEREIPLPKSCPKCNFVKPASVAICPKCGFKPEKRNEIIETDSILVKINKKPSVIDKQIFYSELLGLGKEKGYSKGRIAHLYKEKFSVYPRDLDDISSVPSKQTRDFVTSRNIAYAKRKRISQ